MNEETHHHHNHHHNHTHSGTNTETNKGDKIRSLLRGVRKLPYPYGFWFENKSKAEKSWDGRIAIWKATAFNPCNGPAPGFLTDEAYNRVYNDNVVADINLLENDVVEIIFYYRDVYNYLKPCFENSETKFKLIESNNVGLVSPKENRGCFIATEIYGDINAPEVKTLRTFRDNSLSKNPLGRKFINFYYSGFGKKTAHLIGMFPFTKDAIRRELNFMVSKIEVKKNG